MAFRSIRLILRIAYVKHSVKLIQLNYVSCLFWKQLSSSSLKLISVLACFVCLFVFLRLHAWVFLKKNNGGRQAPLAWLSRAPRPLLLFRPATNGYWDIICSSFRPLPWHKFFCSCLVQFFWCCHRLRKWVLSVLNCIKAKPMAAVSLLAPGFPTKELLLPVVTNMISATPV